MLIDQFLEYLKYEKRFAKNTVTFYEIDINQYYKFLKKDILVSDFDEIAAFSNEEFIKKWMVYLKKEKNTSAATINRKISSLKSFAKYLIKIDKIKISPLDKILSLKNKKRLPTFVQENKMNYLEEKKFLLFTNDYAGIRDKFILELFYNTGMRLSELLNLKHKDFDLYSKTVKVLGKRNKERLIPLNAYIINMYMEYIEKKNEEKYLCENDNWLFITDKGKKMYPKFVYLKVVHYLSLITEQKKKSPHVLRHTFATHMLNNGAELNAIKEILGHSSLSATQIYTHNSFKKIKKIYKQSHPRS